MEKVIELWGLSMSPLRSGCQAVCRDLSPNGQQVLGWGETESTWHVGHYSAHCTSRGCWMMITMKQSVEWLPEEAEVLVENLPYCRFVHHKSHMACPGLETLQPRWEAGD
jgi:hypothetical protein